MTSKKIILILSAFIFTILFTIFGCRIFFRQNNCKIPVTREFPKIKNLETKPAEENPEVKAVEENLNAETTKEWNTYYDERYKYSINFPAELNADTIYENTVELSEDSGGGVLTTNGGVNFSYPADGPWAIIVNVFENSEFRSLDEWLGNESGKELNSVVDDNFNEDRVVEKRINIDGNEAVVTHHASMLHGKIFEEFKNEKETAFIKDNKLFIIHTRIDDHEKVWNSFKFDK
ncbi:MAG: hypothetical protein ABIC82_04400 [bacterium]